MSRVTYRYWRYEACYRAQFDDFDSALAVARADQESGECFPEAIADTETRRILWDGMAYVAGVGDGNEYPADRYLSADPSYCEDMDR